MKPTEDGYIFECTGKEIYSNCNIIGIDPQLHTHEGRDGFVRADRFTHEERKELADYMISLWTQFKNQTHTPNL